ncbi:MAG TPA: sigma-54-dependent Fis family transcriptional regulator [Gammaproteobacteria bacterium]|nr:sigma-54-dependent Fis family transcriptional regulator [Gammaproteobacteria bacterium]
MNCRICLIEDDEILGEALCERFELEGIDCQWYQRGEDALKALRQQRYHLVVSDIRLPDMSGEVLFSRLRDHSDVIPPFLFITGFGAVDQAVRLLKMGAEDYLTKPFDVADLLQRIKSICQRVEPVGEFATPLGSAPGMRSIEATLPLLAATATTVLITGESGVGKEYVARALHRITARQHKQPFVAVNCGAIPENLMESELFGYQKGAFTGAVRNKKGLFEQAHGGTLFLDEIGDMPLSMQVKLLRAIQERSVQRVGSEQTIAVKLRLICATHRDLTGMVANGQFREDLYFRINVVNLEVPPLRECAEDILWHAERFLQQTKQRCVLGHRAQEAMLSYPWPGNIRELHNCLERASILSPSPTLTPEILFGKNWQALLAPPGEDRETLASYVQQCEKVYIRRILAEQSNRIADTATTLGISRKTLWDKMRRLGLSEKQS